MSPASRTGPLPDAAVPLVDSLEFDTLKRRHDNEQSFVIDVDLRPHKVPLTRRLSLKNPGRLLHWLLPALVALGACSGAPEAAQTTPTRTDDFSAPTSPATLVTVPDVSTTTDFIGEARIAFPTEVFARISENPVSSEAAAGFQALLDDMAGDGGMAATVMTADGTWNGATGTADGVRAVQIDDQFAIGSITKSLVAAQVMQLVEAGELALEDLAVDHLPADLDFNTNQATIRQLLNHRSGLRDPDALLWDSLATDRQHVWTTAEVLELAGEPGWPVDSRFEYSNANYFLLGLIIEQVRDRPLAQVMRDGVLAVDGTERLVYQPDERPSDPMAMPAGESTAALELGGGYLPSIASATAGGPAAAMASDSPSLARWWRAFCAGEVVSVASLSEMAAFDEGSYGYGFGLFNVSDPYASGVGHAGADFGFASWAACLPEQGAVIVVLTNRELVDNGGVARPLVAALQSG